MFSFIRLSRAMLSLHCNKTLSNIREKKAENIALGKKVAISEAGELCQVNSAIFHISKMTF